ncbi:hypothetical protein P692DRAFT_20879894 [Suillus brevipes Sb2]|nr:hypothetical protein P692DRAFT_20879894 [Suillus brevipes Sb2]
MVADMKYGAMRHGRRARKGKGDSIITIPSNIHTSPSEPSNNMAPKKSKAKKADDDGASVFHLNKGPIEAIAPKNDPAKETQRLDTLVAKCKVGVAWIDLLAMKRRLKFGVYNDRPQNEAEVNKLVACFQESGIVSMKDVTAIPLIMKTSRIDNKDSLVKNFDDPDVVPELELDIEDIDNIIVASGQHRLAALEKYNYSLKEQYQKHVSKRKKVEVLKNINQEHVATFNEAHQAMCELKGAMEDVGKWGVVIYDEDKLLADGTTLATHLSRNSTLHEFKQTEEEVLITIFKEIQQVYDTSPAKKQNDIALECLRTLRTAQEKNARLSKVLQHETYCVFFATRVMRLGPHFRHRREFKVNWLAKAIDTNMGLYLSWIQMRIKTLKRLSSKGPFPSYAEVLKLIDDADANVATAKEKLAELRTTLEKRPKTKEKGDVMIWAGVLQTIDKKASTVFTDVEDKVGEMTGAYVTPLSVYRQSAIKCLRDAWGLTSNDEWEENEILAHLDRVCARVLLHLTVETGKARAPEPLLGAFVMDNAWSALNNVKEGVKEVCRWFDALLDYHKGLHPKTHIMDDWSTVMLNNISKDARFTDGGKTYAQEVRPAYTITSAHWPCDQRGRNHHPMDSQTHLVGSSVELHDLGQAKYTRTREGEERVVARVRRVAGRGKVRERIFDEDLDVETDEGQQEQGPACGTPVHHGDDCPSLDGVGLAEPNAQEHGEGLGALREGNRCGA